MNCSGTNEQRCHEPTIIGLWGVKPDGTEVWVTLEEVSKMFKELNKVCLREWREEHGKIGEK